MPGGARSDSSRRTCCTATSSACWSRGSAGTGGRRSIWSRRCASARTPARWRSFARRRAMATRALERDAGRGPRRHDRAGGRGVLEQALRERGQRSVSLSADRRLRAALRPSARAGVDPGYCAGRVSVVGFRGVDGGYCSDVTRTVVVGQADARQREIYEAVAEANRAARAGCVAGMRGGMPMRWRASTLERAGFGELFGHGLGHGIGLEVHEAPRLSRMADEVLPAGAVVTIEPGVYRAGVGRRAHRGRRASGRRRDRASHRLYRGTPRIVLRLS